MVEGATAKGDLRGSLPPSGLWPATSPCRGGFFSNPSTPNAPCRFLWLLTLALTACNQRSNADTRLADADAQERARQEKVAKDMVSRTEDQVRVKMLEQRVAALEAQVAAMQGIASCWMRNWSSSG